MSCKYLLSPCRRPLPQISRSSSSLRCLNSSKHAAFPLQASASSNVNPTRQRARHLHTSKLASPPTPHPDQPHHQNDALVAGNLSAILDHARNKLLNPPKPPNEEEILEWLKDCKRLVPVLNSLPEVPKNTQIPRSSATQDLLFLGDEDSSSSSRNAGTPITKEEAIQQLSAGMYSVMASPAIFITGTVLEAYVSLQCALNRPESLSEIFSLFANKPIPLAGSSPIQYKPARPQKLSSAIPKAVADKALDCAIRNRNMLLCLDIVNTTVSTPAYRRLRAFRVGLLPTTATTLTPLAAYAVASQMSAFQDTMSSELATNMAFVGIMSYMAFTATIGFVAFTTANDQMDRVVWTEGIPLRTRWVMEEQRAMIDKLAGAWGFKSRDRRGEEEGPEWESLREFTGLKGMILDKVSLMEGME